MVPSLNHRRLPSNITSGNPSTDDAARKLSQKLFLFDKLYNP